MVRTPTKIGVLGCGVISGIYIENSRKLDAIELVAVADVNPEAAKFRAQQYDVSRACTPEELLADPEIEIIVSLTPIPLHGKLALEVIQAGKHVYQEKPLTVYREESVELLATAVKKGLRVGGAPDTFFGGAWQTARKAIDDGLIGEPFAAFANLHGRAAPAVEEAPRPVQSPTRSTAPGHVGFFTNYGYKYGVTTTFDRGPYYLNALIHLLGPATRVFGATKKTWDERVRWGKRFKVEAPTHVAGLIEFANGVLCQYLTTGDVYGTGLPHIEVYGTEGSLRCVDPNYFPGKIYLRKPDSGEMVELECRHGYNQDSRGVGVADMAVAIKNGRPHRASGEMAAHVVDILNAMHESWDQGKLIDLVTTCAQPKALPIGLPDWTIDD